MNRNMLAEISFIRTFNFQNKRSSHTRLFYVNASSSRLLGLLGLLVGGSAGRSGSGGSRLGLLTSQQGAGLAKGGHLEVIAVVGRSQSLADLVQRSTLGVGLERDAVDALGRSASACNRREARK